MTAPRFVVGVDLGQAHDFTAVAIVERRPLWNRLPSFDELHVRHLDRLPLGTSYPLQVAHVRDLLVRLEPPSELVVDATGCGRPVVDLFRAGGLKPAAVTITSSGAPTVEKVRAGWDARVAKRDLVAAVAVLLDTGRLKIAKALPLASVLVAELREFRVTVSAAGHDTYGAREGTHDDLVLAVALACWWSERAAARPRIQFGRVDLMSR